MIELQDLPVVLLLVSAAILCALLGYLIGRRRPGPGTMPAAHTAILENMSDAVMVLDQQNRIVDINAVALRLVNQTSAETVIGQPAGEVLAAHRYLVERFGQPVDVHTEIALEVGSSGRQFDLHVSPLHDRNGDLVGGLVVLHEITELKQAAAQILAQNDALVRANQQLAAAREQADEVSQLKSEFLATMSHELLTPLNAVIGYTGMMLSGLAGPLSDRQQDYAQRIMANGERLLALINDILDIAEMEAGRVDVKAEPFSPADVLGSVTARMQSLADQKNLRLESHLDLALPPHLVGDRQRLEQILVNLVDNAIRFTQTGAVRIHFDKVGDRWAMTVTDTGPGIPPYALNYIFDEFRQIDGSSQREHGGTGLGLAIVRKLTVLMQGTVNVESEEGSGSTFRVRLPLVVPNDAERVRAAGLDGYTTEPSDGPPTA